MRKLLSTALIAGGLALAGCKSTPEPVEEVAQAPAPAPVTQAPVFTPAPEPAPAPVMQAAPAPDLPTPGSLEDFLYQSGEDRVYFGYDQFTLTPKAREVLTNQANWLNTYGAVQVVIEGHADERGTREYNLALGARRAEAVKRFLVGQGVAPTRLTTVSYGKERPIDGRSNEEGWARNRNGYTNLVSGAVG